MTNRTSRRHRERNAYENKKSATKNIREHRNTLEKRKDLNILYHTRIGQDKLS